MQAVGDVYEVFGELAWPWWLEYFPPEESPTGWQYDPELGGYLPQERYFFFVEDVGPVVLDEGRLDGPNGRPIAPRQGTGLRIRGSGVPANAFLQASRKVEPLGDQVTEQQRLDRHDGLGELLKEVPVLRIDLWLTTEEGSIPWVRLLAPGAWRLLALAGHGGPFDGVAACLALTNEAGGADGRAEVRTAPVALLLPPRPTHELGLRDIFSLKHVADAGFGEGEEGDTTPRTPPDPDRGGSKIQVQAEADPEFLRPRIVDYDSGMGA